MRVYHVHLPARSVAAGVPGRVVPTPEGPGSTPLGRSCARCGRVRPVYFDTPSVSRPLRRASVRLSDVSESVRMPAFRAGAGVAPIWGQACCVQSIRIDPQHSWRGAMAKERPRDAQEKEPKETGEERSPARRESALRATAMPFASPFSLMGRFMEDLDRIFEVFGAGPGLTPRIDLPSRAGEGRETMWVPPVEVSERDGQLV